MFLLNSRTSLVTAPCNRIHKNTIAGIPYTKDTELICRIPLIGLLPHTLGFSPRGTCAGSGYAYFKSIFVPFSGALEIGQTSHRPAILRFNLVLIITILPTFILINTADKQCWLIQKR